MRAGDKSSVVEFEVDRFETKSEWHVISKSMGAAWQSRGETTLQGICDSNPPRKLLWEHESQIRLCRLASLSYSSPYIHIYMKRISEDIFLLRATQYTLPLPSLRGKWKSLFENACWKFQRLFENYTRFVYIYIYICIFWLDIIPVMKLFSSMAATSFHLEGREIFEKC